MSPREVAARALGIESGAIAGVEPIKHGLTNESWLVHTANDAVVVRVSTREWASLQIDRVAEAAVLDAVATAGIGPEVVASDRARGILVTRYLGPTCEQARMVDDDLIARLGGLFRKLHAMSTPQGIRETHLPSVIAGYLDTLNTLSRTSELTSAEMRDRAIGLATEIANTSCPRLCHNDVHHLNLVDRMPLRLIDWEYAGLGEPFFDLASVCVYHDYAMHHRALLLRAYTGDLDPAHVERLAKCCWLFEYIRDLWTAVRTALESR